MERIVLEIGREKSWKMIITDQVSRRKIIDEKSKKEKRKNKNLNIK